MLARYIPVFAAFALWLFFLPLAASADTVALSAFLHVSGALLPFLLLKTLSKVRKKPLVPYGEKRPDKRKVAYVTFFAFPPFLFATMLLSFLTSLFLPSKTVLPDEAFFVLFLQLVVLPAVTEELLFRFGMLLFLLRDGLSARAALVFTAALFALSHGSVSQLPYAFFAGLFLGALTLYTKSLLPAVFLHGANNACSLLLYLCPYPSLFFLVLAVAAVCTAPAVLFLSHQKRAVKEGDVHHDEL